VEEAEKWDKQTDRWRNVRELLMGDVLMAAAMSTLAAPLAARDARHAHRRGVHAVDCVRDTIATASTDRLVAWSLDRSAARADEAVSVDYPLATSTVPMGLRWLSDGHTLLPVGSYDQNLVPLLDVTTGLGVSATLSFKGTDAVAAVELPADGRILLANKNRALLYDRRAGSEPCARLELAQIASLAALGGEAAPAILAASGAAVHVFDVRKLPGEAPRAKKPPPALAVLERELNPPDGDSAGGGAAASASTGSAAASLARSANVRRGEPFCSVAAMGGIVVAGDHDGGLAVWSV